MSAYYRKDDQGAILALAGSGALGMTLYYVENYRRTRPDDSWPMVQGEVIKRRKIPAELGVRPELTIRILPDGPIVRAILSTDGMNGVSRLVNFRYSGESSKEVMLEEETSPLTIALMFFGLGVGSFLLRRHIKRKLQREYEERVAELFDKETPDNREHSVPGHSARKDAP
jgi:hypothetical protein